jgi:hypothetical protein
VQGIAGFCIALSEPWPEAHIWLWLGASGLFHAGYKLFLAFAYVKPRLSDCAGCCADDRDAGLGFASD